jgi:hypothetical protein
MKVTRFSPSRKVFALLSLTLLAPACMTETDGPRVGRQQQETTCPTGSGKRQSVPADTIKAFYPCCDGSAHLVPDFLVPKDFRTMLEAGPEGTLCVPDEFATDSNYTPTPCISLFGLKGACLSSCIPQVRDAAVKLPQDVCQGNQLCAPCIDPQTNKESGACNQGAMACDPPSDGSDGTCTDYQPSLDVSPYASCGAAAHCAPENLVSEKQRGDLAKCKDGVSYCVPDKFLTRGGHYTPPTCRSLANAEGRCLSTSIPKVAEANKGTPLPLDSCDPLDEICVPCYDPRTGIGTGACTQGFCDAGPADPPKTFEQCGASGPDALCVPASLIPGDQLKNFDAIGCRKTPCSDAGSACVPKKIVDAGIAFHPKKCTNSLTGFLAMFMSFFGGNMFQAFAAIKEYSDGRCLSKCLPAVRPSASLLGSNKDCDADEVCAPCYDPQKLSQGKVPTGACDH